MITKIVAALRNNAPQNMAVCMFGDGKAPGSPYVVVKQESDIGGRGTAYRIIAHFLPGQQLYLEDYIRDTVAEALDDLEIADRHGNLNKLYNDEFDNLPQLTISNDDGTISMDRVYYMPDKYYS